MLRRLRVSHNNLLSRHLHRALLRGRLARAVLLLYRSPLTERSLRAAERRIEFGPLHLQNLLNAISGFLVSCGGHTTAVVGWSSLWTAPRSLDEVSSRSPRSPSLSLHITTLLALQLRVHGIGGACAGKLFHLIVIGFLFYSVQRSPFTFFLHFTFLRLCLFATSPKTFIHLFITSRNLILILRSCVLYCWC